MALPHQRQTKAPDTVPDMAPETHLGEKPDPDREPESLPQARVNLGGLEPGRNLENQVGKEGHVHLQHQPTDHPLDRRHEVILPLSDPADPVLPREQRTAKLHVDSSSLEIAQTTNAPLCMLAVEAEVGHLLAARRRPPPSRKEVGRVRAPRGQHRPQTFVIYMQEGCVPMAIDANSNMSPLRYRQLNLLSPKLKPKGLLLLCV
jgi:hypothetical protein